jgi:hypothetical protein
LKKKERPKIPKKSTLFPKISRSKSPKNLKYTKGTTRPYYLYEQKKIKDKIIILRPVERGPISFLQKTRKKSKNGL